jgi:hypothetical protein
MSSADTEWDGLAAALNAYGIFHVVPGKALRRRVPSPPDLYRRLALSGDPRLQEALAVLLLTHPDTANAAQAAIGTLTGTTRDRAMRRYVAAAALQRMWRTRLELALGQQWLIEPAYLHELGLPDLDEEFGEGALWELSRQEEGLYGYDAWNGYRSLMDLGQCRLRGWGKKSA